LFHLFRWILRAASVSPSVRLAFLDRCCNAAGDCCQFLAFAAVVFPRHVFCASESSASSVCCCPCC
jgi:hypothetical protein